MKFTIILPIYNTPECILKSCFDSIAKQTIKDYELIVIDDGSSFECSSFIDTYLMSIPNSHVIHKENEGVSVARNIGIKEASGDYILFLDSDNTLPLNTLEIYKKYIGDNDIIIGQSIFLNRTLIDNNDNIENYDYKKINENITYNIETENDWKKLINHVLVGRSETYSYKYGYFADGPCGKLFKTSLVKQTYYPIELKWDEDTVWLLSYFDLCKSGIIIPDYVYNNVSYQLSATKRYRENCIEEFHNVTKVEIEVEKKYPNSKDAFLYHYLHNILLVARLHFFHPDNKLPFKEKYLLFANFIKENMIQSFFKEKKYSNIFDIKNKILIFLINKKICLLLYFILSLYNK